jgi:urease subunit alpha
VDLTIGPNTWPVDGYGLIATVGGIDSHVHLMSPRLVPAALSAGITTLITAGFEEPPYVMDKTLRAFEYLPVNLGLQASARTDVPGQAESVLEAGACGLKIHEDWGAYPEIIDATLRLADAHDVAVCLHTDGLNESCELEDTIEAIGGRAVHAYHVEGAGGGHVPDLIGIVGEPNVVCSSTTPTIPYGPATAAEHLEMILLVHGGSAGIQEDVDAARERIHPATMAAEGPLHELGAISIVNSDSQGMGRIGETIRRTWQLAHAMKLWRQTPLGHGWPGAPAAGRAGDPAEDDNERVLQYPAKYTAEPARVHGIEEEAGSLRPGRLADIVLWRPAHFGVRPELVLKGGWFSWGPIGAASPALSTTFVSASADHAGIRRRLGSSRRFTAVRGTRRISRADLVANTAVTPVEVDLPAGTVRLRGRVLRAEPVPEVPLSRATCSARPAAARTLADRAAPHQRQSQRRALRSLSEPAGAGMTQNSSPAGSRMTHHECTSSTRSAPRASSLVISAARSSVWMSRCTRPGPWPSRWMSSPTSWPCSSAPWYSGYLSTWASGWPIAPPQNASSRS